MSYSDTMMGLKHWQVQVGDWVRHPTYEAPLRVKAVLTGKVILRFSGKTFTFTNSHFDEMGFYWSDRKSCTQ